MTRPDNIPPDVWDAALGTYSEKLPPSPVALVGFEAIARAILAERERCADIADTTVTSVGVGGGEFYIAGEIAAAIRKGDEK